VFICEIKEPPEPSKLAKIIKKPKSEFDMPDKVKHPILMKETTKPPVPSQLPTSTIMPSQPSPVLPIKHITISQQPPQPSLLPLPITSIPTPSTPYPLKPLLPCAQSQPIPSISLPCINVPRPDYKNQTTAIKRPNVKEILAQLRKFKGLAKVYKD